MTFRSALLSLALITVPLAAQAAPNLVLNGDFSQTTTSSSNGNFQVTSGGTYGTLANWGLSNSSTTGGAGPFALLFTTGAGGSVAQTTTTAGSPSNPNYAVPSNANQYGTPQYLASGYNMTSPTGGNFIALDGDQNVNGKLTQTVNYLTAGTLYELTFYWAAAQIATSSGATTDSLQVSFGNSTVSTAVVPIANAGFSGWIKQTFLFTATSTSQVLSFLSVGTPSGAPPAALLDGISLTAAPEPSTVAIFGAGLVAVAAFSLRRRRQGNVAA